MRSTLSFTLNFLFLIIFIATAFGPITSLGMEADNKESAQRDLKWDFAKVSHLMRANAQDLKVKGADKEAKRVEHKAALQAAFLNIFDALQTDGDVTTIDIKKLEAFCKTIEELKGKSTQHVSSTDQKLELLKTTPPEKLFIRGLPYRKNEAQTTIAQKLCSLPSAISVDKEGIVTLEGPLIEAFVYNVEGFVLSKSLQTLDEHVTRFGQLLQNSGRKAAAKYCKEHTLEFDDMYNLLL